MIHILAAPVEISNMRVYDYCGMKLIITYKITSCFFFVVVVVVGHKEDECQGSLFLKWINLRSSNHVLQSKFILK